MKATDFNLQKEINFNFESRITSFKNNRLLIVDSDSIGLLRQNLVNLLGIDQARIFFLKFGYQNGFADFVQTKVFYEFDNELELLNTGTILHSWEGVVKATPDEFIIDRENKIFSFAGTWFNSYEAEQHLSYNPISVEPVCWNLMGYASGWCSAFWGEPIIAIETKCVGQGDEHCRWLAKPISQWDKKAINPYISAFKEFWGEK
jgi:hypothetical protein